MTLAVILQPHPPIYLTQNRLSTLQFHMRDKQTFLTLRKVLTGLVYLIDAKK